MSKRKRKYSSEIKIKIDPTYLHPKEDKHHTYSWPQFEIRKNPDKHIYGLYTKNKLDKCTFLPYLGSIASNLSEEEFNKILTFLEKSKDPSYRYLRYRTHPSRTLVNGLGLDLKDLKDLKESESQTPKIGARGLAIAGRINEPSPEEEPNLATFGNFYVTTKPIQSNQELLTCYGRDYVRDYKYNKICKRGLPMPTDCKKPESLNVYKQQFNIKEPIWNPFEKREERETIFIE